MTSAIFDSTFQKLIHDIASDTSKQYFISGAPQCPYPDQWLGDSLNNAWYDFVWVQFCK